MVMQGQALPFPVWSKDDTARNGKSVLIDQFLQEAVQILRHVDSIVPIDEEGSANTPEPNESVSSNAQQNNESDDDDDDDGAIVWQLNLTPTMMTLNTSILTVSGLEKVLELIRINVSPQPPKLEDLSQRRLLNISTAYDTPLLRHTLTSVLELSMRCCNAPLADQQHFGQYNTVQMMRHCVQSFIDCGHSFFLDVPSLVANTEMILSQPGAAKGHTVETLLILSICTVMIRHTTLHHRGNMSVANMLMHSYYAQARHLLQELFDVQHISVLQSMFLLSTFPQEHTHLFSPTRLPSTLLTMAIRMALAMDLHKLDIQDTKESDQKEKLRRLAWMLFCADYYAQWNSSGHSGTIDLSNWHVNFPQRLPNETIAQRVEFFSHYCRVIVIRKMNLFKSAYMYTLNSCIPQKEDLHPHAHLDQHQLFKAYFNTPEFFQLDLDNINQAWNNKSKLEPLLLHELYCHTLLFAQLPFLPAKYLKAFFDEYEVATTNADLQHIHQQFKMIIPMSSTSALQTPHASIPSLFLDKDSNNTAHTTSTSPFITSRHPELELHCVIDILSAINDYTLILEALALIDTLGCFHSPIYGTLLTVYTYLIIDAAVIDIPEIQMLCQINLVRTQRVIQQTKSISTDPVIHYIERLLVRRGQQQQQQQQQIIDSKTENDFSQAPSSDLHRRAHELMQFIRSNKSQLLRQK